MEAAIYTDNFSNKIEGISVMKVECKRSARVIGAPVETGKVIFDNKVIDPAEVVVHCVLETHDIMYMQALIQLDELFYRKDKRFASVCDGVNTYSNLVLTNVPTERDVDKIDFLNFDLIFKQVMTIQSSDKSVMDSDNSSFVSGGVIQGVLS